MTSPIERLKAVLQGHDALAIAVSGGVDSLTLAYCAAQWMTDVIMIHAVSPAVPKRATERVKRYAKDSGWSLKIIDSGEFNDPDYRANPYNRCFFCKSNLYKTMAHCHDGTLASGTNLDDLGDYRPGLLAAKDNQVIHPFVEAKITKDDLREIAKSFGLADIANLPAQPCLSSRIETGIPINAGDLAFIEKVEVMLREMSHAENLRCRVTSKGIRIETDQELSSETSLKINTLCKEAGYVFAGVGPYQRGSAFVDPQS